MRPVRNGVFRLVMSSEPLRPGFRLSAAHAFDESTRDRP
jgi:hypothetical protein